MARTPGFFIVGAPKCGTSSMYTYLRGHPEVFLPDQKEPHHFGRDLRSPRFVNDRADYLRLYDGAGDATALGDASVWYLYSRYAAEEIHAFEPDARIIIMLRDPVQLVHSLHTHNVANGIEDILDLGEAFDAPIERVLGRTVGLPAIPEFVGYDRVARFADQIERYQRVFSPERIHVIVYEEFSRDVDRAYGRVLEFLGVDATFRPRFERVNAARRSRSRHLASWLYAPPPRLQRAVRSVVPASVRRRLWRGGLRPVIIRANTEGRARAPLPAELERRLREAHADDVWRTAQLIGRPDLPSLWGYDVAAPSVSAVAPAPVTAGG